MKRSLADIPLRELGGKRVLVRADLNLPTINGRIVDDSRARAFLPTLRTLVAASARVIILSHFGRPRGVVDPRFTLVPVAARLSELLEFPVEFVADPRPQAALRATAELRPGSVVLLEHTCFPPGEVTNDGLLARNWADLG